MNQFDTIFEQLFKGIASGKTIEDLAKKHNVPLEQIQSQLDKGIEAEMDHTKDRDVAKKIAMDHIFEVPDFYDQAEKIKKK